MYLCVWISKTCVTISLQFQMHTQIPFVATCKHYSKATIGLLDINHAMLTFLIIVLVLES